MTMMRVALGLLLLSAPLSASAQEGQPEANQTSAKKAKARTYCIEYKLLTGSRIATKECNTREGWAKQGVNVDQLGKD